MVTGRAHSDSGDNEKAQRYIDSQVREHGEVTKVPAGDRDKSPVCLLVLFLSFSFLSFFASFLFSFPCLSHSFSHLLSFLSPLLSVC